MQKEKINLEELSLEDTKEVMKLLLEHLKLEVYSEHTPDYTAYYLEEKK